jgi:Protein of unknown function (DUF1194)
VAHVPRRRFPHIRRFFKTAHRSDCKTRALAWIGLGLWLCIWSLPARSEAVDFELVLAVDTSISVSRQEFTLQVVGLARAFRDPRVLAGIQAASDRGIVVSLVQWASHNGQVVAMGWTKVQDLESALRLSDEIARMPSYFAGYGTAISSALRFCTDLFFGNSFEARRSIIDVSGDGSDNRRPMPSNRRDIAVSLGITINGLAIRKEET